MAGRKPAEAVQRFFGPVQRALSCVTPAVVRVSSYDPGGPHVLVLNDNEPVRLRGRTALWLSVKMQFRVLESREEGRGPWKVNTAAYHYALRDAPTREFFSYHWHPEAAEEGRRIEHPHLHVWDEGRVGALLRKAHLPTGRVALEEVLRLLITDLGVKPRRADSERVLRETQAAFQRWRTWA